MAGGEEGRRGHEGGQGRAGSGVGPCRESKEGGGGEEGRKWCASMQGEEERTVGEEMRRQEARR